MPTPRRVRENHAKATNELQIDCLITANKSTAAKARSIISCTSEAATAIAPTTAESARSGTADEAAAAEINFRQFAGVLSAQIVQHGVDTLMITLNRRAWAVQL
jgi:hypothetical protein